MNQKTIGTIAIVAALVAVLAVPVSGRGRRAATRRGAGKRKNPAAVGSRSQAAQGSTARQQGGLGRTHARA